VIHKITTSVVASESGSNSGTTVTATTYQPASNSIAVDTVYGTVTNEDLPIAFTSANIKSMILLANKDLTIKVNSTSAPDVTLSLKAGIPLVWQADSGYFSNPLASATTVSHFYLTSAASVRFQALIISN
jgi:hypothetical protein